MQLNKNHVHARDQKYQTVTDKYINNYYPDGIIRAFSTTLVDLITTSTECKIPDANAQFMHPVEWGRNYAEWISAGRVLPTKENKTRRENWVSVCSLNIGRISIAQILVAKLNE